MINRFPLKEAAPFVQFTSVKLTDDFNSLFDVEKTPKQTAEDYCQQLINHSFSITHSQIPDFICHHCNLVKDSLAWLNKFEKLLTLNEELFSGTKNQSRLVKFYTCIETKRNKITEENEKADKKRPAKKHINAESEDRYFSFYELKKQLAELLTDKDRIMLLTKEKFEYQQASIETININTLAYDEQCDKEIQHIYAMRKLKEDLEREGTFEKSPGTVNPKIRIGLNINQLVDIFYQMITQKTLTGVTYLDANANQITDLIVNNFLDKDGNEISPQTVRTILKPSKEEKRPNTGKRIDLDKLL